MSSVYSKKDAKDATTATPDDINIPSNYVAHTLANEKALPPIQWSNLLTEINWISTLLLTLTPLIGCVGAYYTKLRWETAVFAVAYYFFTGLGITAGYHRLWAHRSYNAGKPLQYFLALAGAGAAEGSIRWWSRGHRAHHRYTDTDLDPYNAHKGFAYSHIVWMLIKPRRKPGVADVSDLRKNPVVRWQDKNYVQLMVFMSFILPTLIAKFGWGDAMGGYIYAGVLRLVFVHHSTFCVNSLAHWLGETPFDDKHTPRDHFITALVTIGEGYHNFHHQFPMDYRNAIKWYQYDPTKWFIWVSEKLGFATQLKMFPSNEIRKGQLTMELKKLKEQQDGLTWPKEVEDLPVVSWDAFEHQSALRPLVVVSGFIHDLTGFMSEHPGGEHLLKKYVGKDATTAFFGGVYDHSNAAHNLLAMKRVGVLHGGYQLANPVDALGYDASTTSTNPSSTLSGASASPLVTIDEKPIPPSQRLKIAKYSELRRVPGLGGAAAGGTTAGVAGEGEGWATDRTAFEEDGEHDVRDKKDL